MPTTTTSLNMVWKKNYLDDGNFLINVIDVEWYAGINFKNVYYN